jgi:hypothetical protein
MSDFNVVYGDSDDEDRAGRYPLPLLTDVHTGSVIRKAIVLAVASDRAIAVIGPKGSGKTMAIREGEGWFESKERGKRRADHKYRPVRVLRLLAGRGMDYRQSALEAMRQLDPKFNARIHGKKKTDREICLEFAHHLVKHNYGLILIDEAEVMSDATLDWIRDIMSLIEEIRSESGAGDARARGIAMVVAGDETFEQRWRSHREAGQRWSQVEYVQPLSVKEAARVLASWLPSTLSWSEQVGVDAWENYLLSTVAIGRSINFRRLSTATMNYLALLERSNAPASDLSKLPFNRQIWDHVTASMA